MGSKVIAVGFLMLKILLTTKVLILVIYLFIYLDFIYLLRTKPLAASSNMKDSQHQLRKSKVHKLVSD